MSKHTNYDILIDDNLSDEAIHAIHQFLKNVLQAFESKAFDRLQRYEQALKPHQHLCSGDDSSSWDDAPPF